VSTDAATAFKRLGLAFRIADLNIALGLADRVPGHYSPEAVERARVRRAELEADFERLGVPDDAA